MELQRGSRYTRMQVKDILGGSIQGGILSTHKAPVVILYSDRHGKQYGYEDEWKADGFYHYTGAGQDGPMEMVRGNKAIRDHTRDGKSLVLLIETEQPKVYRFEGFMEYVDHYEKQIPAKGGGTRKGIIFRLRAVEEVELPSIRPPSDSGVSLTLLRHRALRASSSSIDKTTRLATYRERSAIVKEWVLARARGFCEGCGQPAPFARASNSTPYLETHHTRRVSDDGLDAPEAVVALCPTCHRYVHHGAGGAEYNARLAQVAAKAEKAYADRRIAVVTAAVISDAVDRVLVCQRNHGSLAGYWEFPGGKVDEGEEPRDSIRRELKEELRLDVDDVVPFMMTDYDYEDFYLRLLCFRCTAQGEPVLLEHSDARWVRPADLGSIRLAPADLAVGRRLGQRG
ncbi:MAG: NUDIX domain-containing protein [Bacillota bacterium]